MKINKIQYLNYLSIGIPIEFNQFNLYKSKLASHSYI